VSLNGYLGKDEEEPLEGDVAAAVVGGHEKIEQSSEEENDRKQKVEDPLTCRPGII
jgi:hypothetical protein